MTLTITDVKKIPRRRGLPKGFKHSPETIERMRQSALKRWAEGRGTPNVGWWLRTPEAREKRRRSLSKNLHDKACAKATAKWEAQGELF